MKGPVFIGPARPEEKMGYLAAAIGKTISKIEFGEKQTHPEVHRAEAIVLHFTDGTALSITVGSNAQNLASNFPGLKPKMFSTDLMVFWVQR